MRASFFSSKLMLLLIFGPGMAHAADTPVPLDAGTYVVASYKPCNEAPLAGVTSVTNGSFQGPHESNCRTDLLSRHGANFRFKTTCEAQGDGTPAVTSEFVQNIQITSRSTFVATHGREHIAYALCPAFH